MPRWLVVEVNRRGLSDRWAARSLMECLELANPDHGDYVHVWQADATDAGSARLVQRPSKRVGPLSVARLAADNWRLAYQADEWLASDDDVDDWAEEQHEYEWADDDQEGQP